jgi:hypothetical protein
VQKREKCLSFSLRRDRVAEGTDENGFRRHSSAEPKTLWLWSVEDTSKDSLLKFQPVTENAAQSCVSIASGQ